MLQIEERRRESFHWHVFLVVKQVANNHYGDHRMCTGGALSAYMHTNETKRIQAENEADFVFIAHCVYYVVSCFQVCK